MGKQERGRPASLAVTAGAALAEQALIFWRAHRHRILYVSLVLIAAGVTRVIAG